MNMNIIINSRGLSSMSHARMLAELLRPAHVGGGGGGGRGGEEGDMWKEEEREALISTMPRSRFVGKVRCPNGYHSCYD